MTYTYNPILVAVSVLVAIAGAYACFDLVIRVQRTTSAKRRKWLALAALAIGGSIWAMHFIATLAVELPSTGMMQYDILITLVSGLVSILMTAAALAIVSVDKVSTKRIVVGGAVLGSGITAMHYVGMSGMRGNFELSYELVWLITSIVVGIFASTLSLWLVMGLQLRGVLRRLLSAMVMGLSIAGVHYSGMQGTEFNPILEMATITQPILNPFSLGLITALVTFGILGWTLLMLLPATAPEPTQTFAQERQTQADSPALPINEEQRTDEKVFEEEPNALPELNTEPTTPSDHTDTNKVASSNVASSAEKVPVQRNQKTFFLEIDSIASISADGHYSTVRTLDGQSHFCNVGFNKLLEDMPSLRLTRVHRSHAINLNCVVSFQRKRDKAIVNLGQDEHEVPVSRTHVSMVQDALGLGK